jgi:voltage-gated potassium channel
MRPAENQSIRLAARRAATVLVGVVGLGTAGYSVIEGWSPFDSLYMTIVTLSTVGYGETHALSAAGRAFTLLLIFIGVGNIAYSLGAMTEFFAAGGWRAYRQRARMQHDLDSISGHTIVCGYGRLGSAIVRSLRENHSGVVIIERNKDLCHRAYDQDDLAFVNGDAEADEVLRQAGIERAHALVAALDNDASNVFLCLTARVLNPHLVIYGKADDPATLVKLERAGANHQFSPSQVAGHRVAWQIVRPAVTDLIGIATDRGKTELAIEELRVGDMAGLEGKALARSKLWGAGGVMVLAVKTQAEGLLFPPRADYVLAEDDRVVVMGKVESLARLGIGAGMQ